MFKTVLVANRGEIAVRIIRSLKALGVRSVAVYSEADAGSLHVRSADEAVAIGGAAPRDSYLDQDRILAAVRATGAEAIHPGYGFLSENADFAAACARQGVVFIGPTEEQIRLFGLKHEARNQARRAGVGQLPGSGLVATIDEARRCAERIGYPVMVKSTAGGGGIGMRLCTDPAGLEAVFSAVSGLARAHFKDGGVFLERYVAAARHIEVQVFGNGQGGIVALGERDCSVQRRHQKVIEETPAPGIPEATRAALRECAVRLMAKVRYRSAGTVEFIYDTGTGEFYFLEVNTRLQVEHGITELATGVDLVAWMVRLAAGDDPTAGYRHAPRGVAIEARVYAEDPALDFRPSTGTVTALAWPPVRVDTWIEEGTEITAHYDPLLAKIQVHGKDRQAALAALHKALAGTCIGGLTTNVGYIASVTSEEAFCAGRYTTAFLEGVSYEPAVVEILDPGLHTTLQDYPGRVGFWHVGVPPSGPMDSVALRTANRLVGNAPGALALEMTMTGARMRLPVGARIAVTGAAATVRLDGQPVAMWAVCDVPAGGVLGIDRIDGPGLRCYLAIGGGFDSPSYLGSASTFALGGFGGHQGRVLRGGDRLPFLRVAPPAARACARAPVYPRHWRIGVLYGPHGAPDFFLNEDMDTFFTSDYEVHYQSNRTGVRLKGPKPRWARADGGEAGLHPSNIHDNAYAIGAIDFTGDMPVILGPDGPSLGGFVCPAVVVAGELWKLGQLRPGDTVRFVPLTPSGATALEDAVEAAIERGDLAGLADDPAVFGVDTMREAIICTDFTGDRTQVVYRRAGDKYLLVEYGPFVLDIALRLQVHALHEWLLAQNGPERAALVDLTPGIRSLQIHYDNRLLSETRLLAWLREAHRTLPPVDAMRVRSRVVHLPLAWNDSEVSRAIAKYQQVVRKDAPWCPSNIEFIRRVNGLKDTEAVREIVFAARYLVLGLGDVYLGAPVATPLDPRHRLVTTKYNPARTWTPENAVGIGGAYLCIYGMEGPGGYQLVGRTLPVWNRHRRTEVFEQPWLLRFFDQIRFYPVSEADLVTHRADFLKGRYRLRIDEEEFSLAEYRRFLAAHADSIAAFKSCQQAAFDAERRLWGEQDDALVEEDNLAPESRSEWDADQYPLAAPAAGSVWRIGVHEGDLVDLGDTVVTIESMKMEIHIGAGQAGIVERILCQEGRAVGAGDIVAVIRVSARTGG